MTTPQQHTNPLVTTAELVGRVLGQLAARVDVWRGRPNGRANSLERVINETRERVKQETREASGAGLATLGEIVRVRGAS